LNLKKAFKSYWLKLKNNILYRNIAIVAGGNIAARLIGIVTTPIITRLYSPENYGVYSIFVSIFGIIGPLSTLRYSVTIPIAENEDSADDILKLCFFITSVLSLLLFFIVSLFRDSISRYYDSENLKPFLWLIPVVFFFTGIYEALINRTLRQKQFRIITRTKLNQSISSSVIKIGLGTIKIGPWGLFLGQIAQEAAGIGTLFSRLLKARPTIFKSFSWDNIRNVAKRYKNFPLVQSWSQLLLALSSQLPVLLLATLYGPKAAGIFGLANSMVNLPMDLIGQSVAQVYYAEISKYGKDNLPRIYSFSLSISKKLLMFGMIPTIFLILFGPQLFLIVFGKEWHEAGRYAQLLSIYSLFRFISSPIMNCLNVLEKQALQLMFNILRVIVLLLAFYISYKLKMTINKTVFLYSIINAILYLIILVRTFIFLKPRDLNAKS